MDIEEPIIPCTVEESKEIKPINKDTVHRICSGQVVLTLAIAMKELVENAIDAGANIIDIHLKEYGSELLEVSDNGSGVHEDNFQALTLKHYTSKIREFNDLEQLSTMGFRGEALSSLCALSEIEVTSKHETAETATKLKYDYGGNIISKEIAARQQGTTVTLKNLFSTLPVRKREFSKNLKKEFSKMCNLLYAYCLLPAGIKYKCTNATANGSKNIVVATEGNKTVRENIISVFGVKQLASLIDVKEIIPEEKLAEEYGLELVPGEELPFTLEFLISNAIHGSGRSSTDRQFFYINHRPCEPTKVIKLVNEVFRQFNNKQYPFVYLNIITKSCIVDVNITPDKRQVFLEKEKILLATVKASLLEAFKDSPSILKVQNLDVSLAISSQKGIKRNLSEGSSSILETFKKKSRNSNVSPKSQNGSFSNIFQKSSSDPIQSARKCKDHDLSSSQIEADAKLATLVEIACRLVKEDEMIAKPEVKKTVIIDKPQEDLNSRREVPLNLNFASLKEKINNNLQNSKSSNKNNELVKFRSNIAPEANKSAEEELNKHISKTNFKQMEIIGQFNLGFIVAKLFEDLFLIDQHATDEKYNFEQLQLNTVIDSQKLVNPKLLELTAAAKATLLEHENIFKKNGFNFKKQQTESCENILLTSVPMSDKTIFGKNDIDEMIFMLQEDSSQDKTCRPSKVRAMFASRACRKSVMIGTALSKTDMRKLVDHMGEIDQPWNCPHGRPTMRHLVNLSLLTENISDT
ncbi:unnamed protein product [Ceutorhynchus assimilis]|uniref:Mismatch repair endonuclease PMS2 n=1 Tax=Ceutorhynchus assimilis TaxID=467358 RepID=A0A9N9MU77_9CUCU|nr:unnamed protein product [Ceutorhynchus assimilis]